MITAAFIFWILAIVVVAVLFALSGNAVALALLIGLVLYIPASWFLARRAAKRVVVELKGAASCVKGSVPRLSLVMSGMSRLPLPRVDVALSITNLLTQEKDRTRVHLSAFGRGCIEVPLSLESSYCGCVEARVKRVCVRDLFAVVGSKATCDASRMVTVFPQPFDGALHLPAAPAPDAESVNYAPNRKGNDPTEVFALREYTPGDSLRTVHWKLSAKTGVLTVKEPSLPIDQRVLVFWDHSSVATPTPAQADAMALVACALARELLDTGSVVTLGFDQPQQNRCVLVTASDEAELTHALSQAMRQPQQAAQQTGAVLYAQSDGRVFSQVLYVGCETPDLGQFGTSSITALVCDETEDVRQGVELTKIGFGADTAVHALEVVSAL